ncbi:hypothetical protein CFC21_080470 [Triticum aestivum]|uniref:Uncharacterized protein n=3 Tax=Triticinae TaxID=1648030 RepID=A0A3B6N177_WHEAT|nr:uncharacterized protein LOC109784152 isoform X1 [Aegilops tauschii subsp. strangulata]XP_044402337.1 uncharacterized protein LOC123125974 isoform X1 [Triticum aestivum]KAF7075715.1 hypothetical protein CFC21_080470 [Triticum aestivum]
MAMDFPIDPVDSGCRLPIFPEEAGSVVAHIGGMFGAGLGADEESANGSRGERGEAANEESRSSEILGAPCRGRLGVLPPYKAQPSVAAGGGAVSSAFSQSEGGSADVIEHGVTKGPVNGDQLALIESVLRVMMQHPLSLLATWICKPQVGLEGQE